MRWITIGNPPVNLIGADAANELSAVMDELSGDDNVRVASSGWALAVEGNLGK